jgi:hypothetical protein
MTPQTIFKKKKYLDWVMAQVVEHLPSKCKALRSVQKQPYPPFPLKNKISFSTFKILNLLSGN